MSYFSHGRFRQQAEFLKRQFLQEGDLPSATSSRRRWSRSPCAWLTVGKTPSHYNAWLRGSLTLCRDEIVPPLAGYMFSANQHFATST